MAMQRKVDLRLAKPDELQQIPEGDIPGLKVVGLEESKFKGPLAETPDALRLRARAVQAIEFSDSRTSVREVFGNAGNIGEVDGGDYARRLQEMSGREFGSAFSPLDFFIGLRRTLVDAGAKEEVIRDYDRRIAEGAVEALANPEIGKSLADDDLMKVVRGASIKYGPLERYSEEERKWGCDVLESGLASSATRGNCANALFMAFGVLSSDRKNGNRPALDALSRNVDALRAGLMGDNNKNAFDHPLFAVASFGEDAASGKAFDALDEGLRNKDTSDVCAIGLNLVLHESPHEDRRRRAFHAYVRGLRDEGSVFWSSILLGGVAEEDGGEFSRPAFEVLRRGLEDEGIRGSCSYTLSRVYTNGGEQMSGQAYGVLREGLGNEATAKDCASALHAALIWSEQKRGQAFETLKDGLGNEKGGEACANNLMHIFETGPEEMREPAFKALEGGLGDRIARRHCAKALSTRSYGANKENSRHAVAALGRNVDAIRSGLWEDQDKEVFAKSLGAIVRFGDEQARGQALNVLEEGLGNEETRKSSAMTLLGFGFTDERGKKANEAIKGLVQCYGFTAEEADGIMGAWRLSNKNENLPWAFERNLSALTSLEEMRPGAAKVLTDEFGVMDYGRYTPQMLARQYDERDKKAGYYGLVIYARADDSTESGGVFYHDSRILDRLSNRLAEHGIPLRVVECGSKYELARMRIKMRQRYGQIPFAIVGGHGHEHGILFGRDSLTTGDLMGEGVEGAKRDFTANPTFILNSCRTGTEGGIGQRLSERLGATVLASEKATSLRDIDFTMEEGKPVFTVSWMKEGSGREYGQ